MNAQMQDKARMLGKVCISCAGVYWALAIPNTNMVPPCDITAGTGCPPGSTPQWDYYYTTCFDVVDGCCQGRVDVYVCLDNINEEVVGHRCELDGFATFPQSGAVCLVNWTDCDDYHSSQGCVDATAAGKSEAP